MRYAMLGLTNSTPSLTVAQGIGALTEELLRYGKDASAFFAVRDADPESAIVNALCAALHLFTMTRAGVARAEPYLAAVRTHRANASERERLFCDAILAWAEGEQAGSPAARVSTHGRSMRWRTCSTARDGWRLDATG
jgi:hypothetical protein